MIASLMMYGRGELADANDRFWHLIRANLMFEAVSGALKHLSSEDQDALGLRGLVRFSMDDYLSVPNPPEDAGVVQNRVGE